MLSAERKCLVSVATYQYLPRAFVLLESFAEMNPGVDALVLVPDLSSRRIRTVTWPVSPSVKILGIDDIKHQVLRSVHRYLNTFEFCCAAKSFLLEYALFKEGYDKALLLDSDICCFGSFEHVWSELDNTDMAVTPHVNSPLPGDEHAPDDFEIANMGYVNGGFWAVKKSDSIQECLQWMIGKVAHYGFFYPSAGLNADQTWMSALPWFFPEETAVLKDPGLNVAYWNLHERRLSIRDSKYFSNNDPLIFMHLSGFDEADPSRLTKHTERRVDDESMSIVMSIVRDYAARLDDAKKRLPLLSPDYSCMKAVLSKRINEYKSVWGHEPAFLGRIPSETFGEIGGRALRKLRSKASRLLAEYRLK
jgi:hypothetical protein